MFKKTTKQLSGFTLIELLIVMGILGVLLTMTIIAINPVQQFNKTRAVGYMHEMSQLANALQQCYVDNGAKINSCYRKLPGYAETPPTCSPNTCGTEPKTTDITSDTPSYNGYYWPITFRGKDFPGNDTYYQYMIDVCPLVEKGYLSSIENGASAIQPQYTCSVINNYNYAGSYYIVVKGGVLYVCAAAYARQQVIDSIGIGVVPISGGSFKSCITKKLF